MAEFKIGRLRYSWKGNWSTSTVYGIDSFVNYNGKAYVCLVAHTAGSFLTDLANGFWMLAVNGSGWKQAWTTSTEYDVNDIVSYGGNLYISNTSHMSAATTALGLEADQSKWTLLVEGRRYVGQWTGGTRYIINDIVKEGPNLYRNTAGHTSSNIFNQSGLWTLFLPGYENAGVWNSTTTYQLGDLVSYGGYEYVSKTQNNINNVPSLDAVDWQLVFAGYEWKSEWTSSTPYKVGDVVTRHGRTYAAIVDNAYDPAGLITSSTYVAAGSSGTTLVVASAANIYVGMIVQGVGFTRKQMVQKIVGNTLTLNAGPDGTPVNNQYLSFIGVNGAYWTLQVPTGYWTNQWQAGTNYVIDDIVTWKNVTYTCVQNHTSATGTAPDLDTTFTYWAYYALHSRNNVLYSSGQIVSYANNARYAVNIGAVSQVLRVNNSSPSWANINTSPNVFYVAPNGQDRADYGNSWDRPWKTIRYACSLVGQGTLYPNASYLLSVNKNWLVAEMYYWMNYQSQNSIAPFSPSAVYDATKTQRDAKYIVDAVIYDMTRGGNSQSVAAALAYFKYESQTQVYNLAVTTELQYFIAALQQLQTLVNYILTGTPAPNSYQALMAAPSPVSLQYTGYITPESGAAAAVTPLFNIIIGALVTQNTSTLPPPNTGIACTIMIKTGTYNEILPISVPENTALVGDELRGVVVQPKFVFNSLITGVSGNLFLCNNTTGLYDGAPVQFSGSLGGVISGSTYYVVGSSITNVGFSIRSSGGGGGVGTTYQVTNNGSANYVFNGSSNPTISLIRGYTYTFNVSSSGHPLWIKTSPTTGTGNQYNNGVSNNGTQNGTIIFTVPADAPNILYYQCQYHAGMVGQFTVSDLGTAGPTVNLTAGSGTMSVYGGDSVQDMFRLRNGTGIRNMTMNGLLGTLLPADYYSIQRPSGGSFTCLDPGSGPNDTTAWIFRRSPYVQNVTTFGQGCTGVKIDGTLHNGGYKSIVANDFTQVIQDGVGAWCTGPDAKSELISVFCYYTYIGYFSESGGRIRSANGNSSYGTFGAVAEGFDSTETPATGIVFNQSAQVQANVSQSFGSASKIVRFFYNNAGSAYFQSTTNLLNNSNIFNASTWTSDNNLIISKNTIAPTGYTEAWTLQGIDGVSGQDYLGQTISIRPPGATYSNVSGQNITGSGAGATFNVTIQATSYFVTINNPGSGYVVTNQILITGNLIGGVSGANDLTITVTGLSGSSINQISTSGTVPPKSALPYTLSIYAKQGNAPSFDLYAIFTGTSTLTSSINFNFNTQAITASAGPGGFTPTTYSAVSLTNGWYRISFQTYDPSAAQTSLTYRIYPRGYSGSANTYNFFYGSQLEYTSSSGAVGFYLETQNNRYTAYANLELVGNGTGFVGVADELRSGAIFQTRVTDPGSGAGGAGYLTASNNAQGGTTTTVTLAASDVNVSANYVGMRVFINSGTGAGQYGYITSYNSTTKVAQVAQESFDVLPVVSTASSGNLFTLASGNYTFPLYTNMPVQLIPTYYSTAVTSSGMVTTTVTAAVGGTVNTLTVTSTANMSVNMPITFSGTSFSTLTPGFTYYISAITSSTTIQISNSLFGSTWLLTTGTGSMTASYPGYTNYLQGSTTNMLANYPIAFTGQTIGGLSNGVTYYINDVIDSGNFTISTNLVTVSATASSGPTDPSFPNTITVGTTSSLVELNPIIFTSTVFGSVADNTKYYIAKKVDSTHIQLCASLNILQAVATTTGSNLITLGTAYSTTGFVANQPIKFVGNTFGGIQAETVYYVQAINDTKTFTISTAPNGAVFGLTTGAGLMTVKTAGAVSAQTTASGTMTGTSTNKLSSLTYSATGSMNGTFYSTLFGGVQAGQTYYINSIPNATTFTLTSVQGSGNPITLTDKTGNMNLAAMGWDNVNIGSPIAAALDSSSVYYIEPRLTYSDPPFSQVVTVPISLSGASWKAIAAGNGYAVAIPSNGTIGGRYYGTAWGVVNFPVNANWTAIAYGMSSYVMIASGSNTVLSSTTDGLTWSQYTLPSSTTWNCLAYGNGVFVALANNTATSAYSTNQGSTWTSGSGLPNAYWTSVAYGNGIFVAISNGNGAGSTQAAYSTDGINWVSSTLPVSSSWGSIAFGNNMFLAVSSSGANSVYTFDGITWYSSNVSITANLVSYGNGVFLAVNSGTTTAYTTDNGYVWKQRSVTGDSYSALAFTWNGGSGYTGQFLSLAGSSIGSSITAGVRTKGRANVTSGTITTITAWEPGSNYVGGTSGSNTLTITDPNATTLATAQLRVGDGALGNPSFVNRGIGYNTSSTAVLITGNGYADQYQTGYSIILNNLNRLPQPGDSLLINGNSTIYKVTSATPVFGTTVPNLEANVQISPSMTAALSPANGTTVALRTKYSQVRLSGHDFLSIGVGNKFISLYPNINSNNILPQNQTIEVNYGRVFFVSTDQDGNFKVGNLFGVQQSTGIVTISATQFGLSGLNSLKLGGIAVGGNSVIITQFSTDSSFTANSDSVVPTQKAIKSYITNRLSQGGANTFTGSLIAGSVQIGNPNLINSTVPNGTVGSVVKMSNKVNISGALSGVDGNMAALDMFLIKGPFTFARN